MIKNIYKKDTTNILLNVERLIFFPKIGNKGSMFTFTILIQIVFEFLASAIREGRKLKSIFADDIVVFVENPQKSFLKTFKITKGFIMFSG